MYLYAIKKITLQYPTHNFIYKKSIITLYLIILYITLYFMQYMVPTLAANSGLLYHIDDYWIKFGFNWYILRAIFWPQLLSFTGLFYLHWTSTSNKLVDNRTSDFEMIKNNRFLIKNFTSIELILKTKQSIPENFLTLTRIRNNFIFLTNFNINSNFGLTHF